MLLKWATFIEINIVMVFDFTRGSVLYSKTKENLFFNCIFSSTIDKKTQYVMFMSTLLLLLTLLDLNCKLLT